MCHLMKSMEVVLLCASINNFVLVNLDRLLSLKFPMKYSSKSATSFKIIKIGILICCLLAFLPALPMWIADTSKSDPKTDGSEENCVFPYENVSDIYVFSFDFFNDDTGHLGVDSLFTSIHHTNHLHPHYLDNDCSDAQKVWICNRREEAEVFQTDYSDHGNSDHRNYMIMLHT